MKAMKDILELIKISFTQLEWKNPFTLFSWGFCVAFGGAGLTILLLGRLVWPLILFLLAALAFFAGVFFTGAFDEKLHEMQDRAKSAPPKEKWYTQTRWIIVTLIFFFPLGIVLLFKYTSWSKRTKGAVSIAAALLFLCFGISAYQNSGTPDTPQVLVPYDIYGAGSEAAQSASEAEEVLEAAGDAPLAAPSAEEETGGDSAEVSEELVEDFEAEDDTVDEPVIQPKTAATKAKTTSKASKTAKTTKQATVKTTKPTTTKTTKSTTVKTTTTKATTAKPTTTEPPPTTTGRKIKINLKDNSLVWVSKTGTRFHIDPGCGGLTMTQITYAEAKLEGKIACEKCVVPYL
ncbi:MAG: hypothetical protein LBS74_09560 [Oscillospiraceae bacterium]|nr:hypothetical protein [Oscillospiraceae bacterium]